MVETSSIAFGRIEEFDGDTVSGWLYSPTRAVTPVLLVDGRTAELVQWPAGRQDVAAVFGGTTATGWKFRVPGGARGARVELFALYDGTLHRIANSVLEHDVLEKEFWRQLEKALEISVAPDAVAVTVWDGAHNPIGRAKVLYDIVGGVRPVVMFAYMMGPFGSQVWPPLADSNFSLVTIPWEERERYHRVIRQAGIAFGTVWICKPRLPNFHLASVVAAPDARLILDLDDNDDHFSRSDASATKVYGGAGLALAKMYEARIPARTVASLPLQRDYGGEIVRHVREDKTRLAAPVQRPEGPIRVGFVGTVRPHKNILGAARALAAARWALGLNIEFHVYGDVVPPQLVEELEETGAVVDGIVPSRLLDEKLSGLDVVLTGFPSADVGSDEANDYQITSKIGDALAMGKPVLVPRSPAVEDLEGMPGIHLFDETDFLASVSAATESAEQAVLPREFTREAGLEGFLRAERSADQQPRANRVFSDLAATHLDGSGGSDGRRTLLLVWKQHDSGLYGRRVDQVARAYKRANPDVNVRILEVLHDAEFRQYRHRSVNHLSDTGHILRLAERKARGGHVDADGVIRDLIRVSASGDVSRATFDYLVENRVMPWNSVVVIFPHNQFYDDMRAVLEPYTKVVDVVDNHFSWATRNAQRTASIAAQYNELARVSQRVVFNSARNKEFFVEKSIVAPETDVDVIPNWYDLPARESEREDVAVHDGRFDVVYSGNMNDRVDWDGLHAIAASGTEIRLHLIGGAERAPQPFRELLTCANVLYHGPQSEEYTLEVLRRAHLGVMPHRSDSISRFMNPLKLYMYEAIGIPVVASAVDGIGPAREGLTIAASWRGFVEAVHDAHRSWSEAGRPPVTRRSRSTAESGGGRYVEMLDKVFEEVGYRSTLGSIGLFQTGG